MSIIISNNAILVNNVYNENSYIEIGTACGLFCELNHVRYIFICLSIKLVLNFISFSLHVNKENSN